MMSISSIILLILFISASVCSGSILELSDEYIAQYNNAHSKTQASANVTIPFAYPLVKQCGTTWSDDLMDTKTVCQVGCLMSSTSMGLAGTGILIDNVHSDPGSLNSWLKNNNGYDGSNDLIESIVPNIDPSRITWPADAMHRTNDLPYATVVDYLKAGRIVIGNVHNGGHFVLLTGYSEDGDTFGVNDSGFDVDTYSYTNDIVGYRIFDMKRE
jgi:hypothetical protein